MQVTLLYEAAKNEEYTITITQDTEGYIKSAVFIPH